MCKTLGYFENLPLNAYFVSSGEKSFKKSLNLLLTLIKHMSKIKTKLRYLEYNIMKLL